MLLILPDGMVRLKRPPLIYLLNFPEVSRTRLRRVLNFQIQWAIREVRRTFFYMISKLGGFTFNNRTYRYFYHSYGWTWATERAVEVPIIWGEVEKHEAERILEVGNVLSHYYRVHHDIVDKYEKAPGVTNVDILNFETSKDYDLIVSISTIEHVAYDEAEFEKSSGDDGATLKAQESKESKSLEEPVSIAIENLKSHLSQAGEIVITVPVGYNPALDRLLNEKKIFTDIRYLKRISKNNIWREACETEIQNVRHDWEYNQFGRANALAVCVFQRVPR